MNDDGDAVRGELHVELEPIGAEPHAVVERRMVFSGASRAPPLCANTKGPLDSKTEGRSTD